MKDKFKRDRQRRKKEGTDGTLKDQVQQRKYEDWCLKYSPDVQFDNQEIYTYNKQIKLLVEYQDELIQADKDRKDNRRGIQDICRMSGSLTQSYFIFDSQEYKVGRKIYYGMQGKEIVDEDEFEMEEQE